MSFDGQLIKLLQTSAGIVLRLDRRYKISKCGKPLCGRIIIKLKYIKILPNQAAGRFLYVLAVQSRALKATKAL